MRRTGIIARDIHDTDKLVTEVQEQVNANSNAKTTWLVMKNLLIAIIEWEEVDDNRAKELGGDIG